MPPSWPKPVVPALDDIIGQLDDEEQVEQIKAWSAPNGIVCASSETTDTADPADGSGRVLAEAAQRSGTKVPTWSHHGLVGELGDSVADASAVRDRFEFGFEEVENSFLRKVAAPKRHTGKRSYAPPKETCVKKENPFKLEPKSHKPQVIRVPVEEGHEMFDESTELTGSGGTQMLRRGGLMPPQRRQERSKEDGPPPNEQLPGTRYVGPINKRPLRRSPWDEDTSVVAPPQERSPVPDAAVAAGLLPHQPPQWRKCPRAPKAEVEAIPVAACGDGVLSVKDMLAQLDQEESDDDDDTVDDTICGPEWPLQRPLRCIEAELFYCSSDCRRSDGWKHAPPQLQLTTGECGG